MKEYYRSGDWWKVRQRILQRDKYKCRRCGRGHGSGRGLQVHHLTYDRLYQEEDKDLILLCVDCHKIADRKRKNSKRFAAVNTYMTKKYGEDWDSSCNYEDAKEEFEDWLDNKAIYGN